MLLCLFIFARLWLFRGMGDICLVYLGVSLQFWAAGATKDRSVFLAVSCYDSITLPPGFPHLDVLFIAMRDLENSL